jgi:hypothetical protein
VHNKIEHRKLLRTVVLRKALVDTRATGCKTEQSNIPIINPIPNFGTRKRDNTYTVALLRSRILLMAAEYGNMPKIGI